MQSNKNKYWFPAKKYGWGWGAPCCWQGWAVFGVWLILFVAGDIFLIPRNVDLLVIYALVITAFLITICFIKGEKPRWRWGKD